MASSRHTTLTVLPDRGAALFNPSWRLLATPRAISRPKLKWRRLISVTIVSKRRGEFRAGTAGKFSTPRPVTGGPLFWSCAGSRSGKELAKLCQQYESIRICV